MSKIYGFRKVFTEAGQGYDTIDVTVGNVINFDSSKNYGMVPGVYENPGLYLSGVDGSAMESMVGDTLIVVSFDSDTLIPVGDPNCWFVPSFTIEYVATNGVDATFKNYFDLTTLTSNRALAWAIAFGNYDDVVQYVTDQADMSYWVQYVRASDFDKFAPSIVDQEWIYYWATQLDSQDFFAKLTNQQYIFQYAIFFPARTSQVKPLLTDPEWIAIYNLNFPNDPIVT